MLRNPYNNFFSFFPTPTFLTSPSFGLDISDESMKFVKLIATKKGIRVDKYGERKVPRGIIESGKIKEPQHLEELLTALRKEAGVTSARVSLPEEQVYLFKLRLQKKGLVSIREGIELLLEEHIPIPPQDTIFDYEILSQNDESLELQVAAIPKNVIDSYLLVFQNSGIIVPSFELEAQAIARALIPDGDKESYMIVDFGKTRTGLSIVSEGVVSFTSTFNFGGITLNNLIQKSFKVDFEEAEKIKKQYGLKRNTDNTEIFPVVLNGISVLRDEISRHFLYWSTHKDEEDRDRPPIKKIILCGGDSNLIGFSDYLSASLKHSVEVANVWVNIVDPGSSIPDITFNKSLSYATALGLALGDFEHD